VEGERKKEGKKKTSQLPALPHKNTKTGRACPRLPCKHTHAHVARVGCDLDSPTPDAPLRSSPPRGEKRREAKDSLDRIPTPVRRADPLSPPSSLRMPPVAFKRRPAKPAGKPSSGRAASPSRSRSRSRTTSGSDGGRAGSGGGTDGDHHGAATHAVGDPSSSESEEEGSEGYRKGKRVEREREGVVG